LAKQQSGPATQAKEIAMTDKSATPKGVLDAGKKKRSTHQARAANWTSIETTYRTAGLSIRQMAGVEGISEAAIRKRAKQQGWVYGDLKDRTQEAAREKLVAEPVEEAEAKARSEKRKQKASAENRQQVRAEEREAVEAAMVEAASDTVVQVVREHRKTIRSSRALLETMLVQLTEAVVHREELELEIEQATDEDANPKRRNRYLRAVSLPTHVVAIRDLSLTLRNLVALEREAFGVTDAPPPPPPPTDMAAIEQARAGFGELRAAFLKRLAMTTVPPA
jgi:hypothetical protein